MTDIDAGEKQFEIEVARNGRAGCKKCRQKCLQGDIRIAKIVANPFGDGKMKSWHHLDCMFEAFKKQRPTTKRIEDEYDIGGFDDLPEDSKKSVLKKIAEINSFFGTSNSKTPKTQKEKSPKILKDNSSIGSTSSKKNSPTSSKVSSDDETCQDDLFQTFQDIVRKVSDHPSYLDKTDIIRKFFTSGSSGVGFRSNIDLWCRLLLPQSDKRIYNLQSKQLVKLFSRIFREDQDEMLEHLEQGDVADTISHFYKYSLKYKSHTPSKSTVTVQQVDVFLHNLSKLTREDDQIAHFEKILKKLTVDDLKMIIRLIKHDLRMSAGPKHILEGIHPDAYQVYNASKNLDDVINRCFGSKKLETAEIKLMTPVFPMLAEPCKSVEMAMKKCPNGMFSEIKYDGERVQVHKHGSDFKYFSRALKPVLPHKVAHFKDHIPKAFPNASDLILDSEILMIDTNTGKPLPFGSLGVHKKAEFRDATVCLFVFDCLFYNGMSLLDKPLKERKRILNDNMTEIPNHIVFSEMKEINDPNELVKMIAATFKLNLEGLVLKDVMSKYEPAKRHWLKVKKDYLFEGAMADSADLIVLGAWYGTGKKGGMMSVFLMGCYNPQSKKFCTVTKVHTGHDDKTLEKLQKELKMIKISADPNKLPSWLKCNRTMIPDFVAEDPKNQPVWEITGAEFTQHDVHTADGISIRFPRVSRIREDKSWDTATNLEELSELYKKSKESFDASLLLKELETTDIKSENKRKNSDVDERANVPQKKVKINVSDNSNSSKHGKKITTLFDLVDKRKQESNDGNTKKIKHNGDKEKRDRISMGDCTKDIKDISDTSNNNTAKIKRGVHIENPLPDYFDAVYAYFENKDDDVERKFIAFGGMTARHEDDSRITHVIHSTDQSTEISRKYPKTAKHIFVKWIKDSVRKGKLQDCLKYAVTWSPIFSEKCELLDN